MMNLAMPETRPGIITLPQALQRFLRNSDFIPLDDHPLSLSSET